jgi:DUF4097 and DUF4098 domain-containing protein YvlB
VRLESGEVRVETTDANEASVELEALNDAGTKAIDDARIVMRDGEDLLVELGGWRFGRVRVSVTFGRGPEVRATLRVPHGSKLRCDVVSADVRAGGRLGEAEIQTVSGDMRVAEVDGRGTFKTVSGDIAVQRVGSEAQVTTVSGDVKVDELVGGGRVKSVSGDVLIDGVAGGSIGAQSVSGDVRVGVRAGTSVFLDLKSLSGKTTSDLPVGDTPPPEGGRTAEVRANTVSGDIRIVRGG